MDKNYKIREKDQRKKFEQKREIVKNYETSPPINRVRGIACNWTWQGSGIRIPPPFFSDSSASSIIIVGTRVNQLSSPFVSMSGRKEILWKSSLASIVPHGMWVNHRRTSNPFSARHAPCPGPQLQVVRPATSCYSNRTRAELRIDSPPPFSPFASRSIFLSFPFLSFLFLPFLVFSLSHFPRDKFETGGRSRVTFFATRSNWDEK